MGHRHHRDRRRARSIKGAQMREQIGGRLDQVSARRKVQYLERAAGALGRASSEGEQRFARIDAADIEPQPRPGRVMGASMPGASGASSACGDPAGA